MQLTLAYSYGGIFLNVSAIGEDSASRPNPETAVSLCQAVSPTACTPVIVTVQLKVPHNHRGTEKIKSLVVAIKASESIAFPSGAYETNLTFHYESIVDEASDMIVQGGQTYSWDLPILVPSNAAPFEKGPHGRNLWRLSACVTFHGFIVNKSIRASKLLCVVQGPPDQHALSYEYHRNDAVEDLGPIRMAFITRSISVGGYLRGALLFVAPSPKMKLLSISMALVQTVNLQSRQRSDAPPEACQPERHVFMLLNGDELENAVRHTSALCRPRPGCNGEIEIEWTTRLPSDNCARPTTLRGSHAAIIYSHYFELRITFESHDEDLHSEHIRDAEKMAYRVTWPVILFSCTARWRSLVLPEYSVLDCVQQRDEQIRMSAGELEHTKYKFCNCGDSLETVLRNEDEAEAGQVPTAALLRQYLGDPPSQPLNPSISKP